MSPEMKAAMVGAVAVLVGAALGAFFAWIAASSTNKIQRKIADENLELQKKLADDSKRSALHSMILKLTEYAIQYPTLEKDSYCSAYPNCPGDENGKERYENYCAYVFNTIGAVWDFCGRDAARVKEMLHVEELIKRHHRCWHGDSGNLGYDQPFRAYVQGIIDDLRRRNEIT